LTVRPVHRGPLPLPAGFGDYKDAFPYLTALLGFYCSYCERRLQASLAVEHVQPKKWNPLLELEWTNFLLACVNCNSTKGDQDVALDTILLPDRDNTFAAYEYRDDGHVAPAAHLHPATALLAAKTLELTGQNTRTGLPDDPNLKFIAIDRLNQRRQAWAQAVDSLNDLRVCPTDEMRRCIVAAAVATGFFSVWMKVYEADVEMRRRFLAAFSGTAGDCFDADTLPVSPRPANGLAHAGKA
jgi:uncharacterized protein (TIGR02646 family)